MYVCTYVYYVLIYTNKYSRVYICYVNIGIYAFPRQGSLCMCYLLSLSLCIDICMYRTNLLIYISYIYIYYKNQKRELFLFFFYISCLSYYISLSRLHSPCLHSNLDLTFSRLSSCAIHFIYIYILHGVISRSILQLSSHLGRLGCCHSH